MSRAAGHFLINQVTVLLRWAARGTLLAALSLSCTVDPPAHAGGSTTEVTNGIVASLVYPDQRPAAAVRIAVRPTSFVAGDTSLPTAQTDSTGTVRITGLTPGHYTLSTMVSDSSLGCVIQDISIGDTVAEPADSLVQLPRNVLAPTGTLFGICGGGQIPPGSELTVSFYGTDFKYRVQADSLFYLQHLPPARYRVQATEPTGQHIERSDVEVRSADTLFIPDLSFTDSLRFSGAKQIHFNTTNSGASITGDVSNFPLLVRLTDANTEDARLFSQVKSSGSLRFLDSTGTGWLPYEVERWDTLAKPRVAEIWVKVPEIYAQNDVGFITLLYGPDVPDGQKKFEVCKAGDGFSAVWHCAEQNGTTLYDATDNGNAGTKKSASEPLAAAGIIGWGQGFDGLDDQIELGVNRLYVDGCAGVTIAVWVNPQANGSTILDIGASNDSSAIRLGINTDGTVFLSARAADSDPITGRISSSSPLTLNVWTYVCGIVDFTNDSLVLYINGIRDNATQFTFSTNISQYLFSKASYLGSNRGTDGYFKGIIDECSIFRAVRTPDWIRLAYESQRQSPDLLMR